MRRVRQRFFSDDEIRNRNQEESYGTFYKRMTEEKLDPNALFTAQPSTLTTAQSAPNVVAPGEAGELATVFVAPQRMVRSVSVDTGLTRANTDSRIHEPTEEKLPDKFGQVRKEDDLLVTVPPREILTKMPLHTVPLTIEATNHAFTTFRTMLEEMGFTEQAEAALLHTHAESIELAVEFIENHPDALYHRFVPGVASIQPGAAGGDTDSMLEVRIARDELCSACGLAYQQHLVDENGLKVEIQTTTDEGPEIIPGDLDGRISMSIATAEEREHQKIQQAEIIERVQTITEQMDAQELEEPPEYDGPTEMCMICFDDRPVNEFYRADCGHNYCHECLQNHYRVKTNDGDVLKNVCIDPDCDREIPHDEMRSFLEKDEELLAKYQKFREDKLVMLNPNARFCTTPDCDGWMLGSRWRPKLICPKCEAQMCWSCSQAWHGYFVGCRTNVDLGYAAWAINKDVQKCPKCHVRIEKAEGCNHMTCGTCRHEFCWICRGPYNSNHFEWWNILFGCPGAQYTPHFCRCPACCPYWLNRLLIIIFVFAILFPLAIVAGVLWVLVACLYFCIRCDGDCDFNICNCC